MVRMAAGATSIPPGSVGTIKMKLTGNGKRVVRANRGRKISGMMSIRNEAGSVLSVTPIRMRIK